MHYKSNNLQYNMLGPWDMNKSLTKHLMFCAP